MWGKKLILFGSKQDDVFNLLREELSSLNRSCLRKGVGHPYILYEGFCQLRTSQIPLNV